ncbi:MULTISPECIES: hypothetical protein [Pontibacillus]|uniref:Uncharacterized protein n=1 Tax=Pontibacillus chungwhensis TaxID=265426 RepID=A0ABY8V6U4_9BACI|nr:MULTISPECIES: hypothetical protein [Pontibacillus]MCD5326142.1 hypothetical protein [Pontibacillus sp. HN14]WIG00300.1 hypothetical protein QNI29_21070 [Pontibacillus chungwhensis]
MDFGKRFMEAYESVMRGTFNRLQEEIKGSEGHVLEEVETFVSGFRTKSRVYNPLLVMHLDGFETEVEAFDEFKYVFYINFISIVKDLDYDELGARIRAQGIVEAARSLILNEWQELFGDDVRDVRPDSIGDSGLKIEENDKYGALSRLRVEMYIGNVY